MLKRIKQWWSESGIDAPVYICTALMFGTFYLADTPYESGFFVFLISQAVICAAMTVIVMLKYRQSYNIIIKKSIYLWAFITAGYMIAKLFKAIANAVESGKYSTPLNFRTLLSMMGVCLWIMSAMLIVRIFTKPDEAGMGRRIFIDAFSSVEKVFAVLWILTLADGFIFIRSYDPNIPRRLKLIPFQTIIEQWKSNLSPFKLFCQYAGNSLLIFPLGFFLKRLGIDKSDKKALRILFYLSPLMLTLFIELTQYIFNIGYCDIDDVILNVAGYYVGVLAAIICNAVRSAVTHKKETNLFAKDIQKSMD